jgi:hypothetical protein
VIGTHVPDGSSGQSQGRENRRVVATICIVLLVGACSGGGPVETTVAPTVPVTPTTSSTVSESTLVSSVTSSSSALVPAGLVQITEDVESWAREYGVVAPDGEYVGPVDLQGRPLLFEPITGYGDFSDYDGFESGARPINDAIFQCMRDQAMPVHQDNLGGVDFTRVPDEQNHIALAVLLACKKGLNQPPPKPLTVDQLAEAYAYRLALADCVRDQGYDVEDPPSLDKFTEDEGMWSPYPPFMEGPLAIGSLERTCPQSPPGGYGSWDPGDPIVPRS